MINLRSLERVYLVGPQKNLHTLALYVRENLTQLNAKKGFHIYNVPTDKIHLDGTESPEQQREALYSLVGHLSNNFDGDLNLNPNNHKKPDPKGAVIVIDSSHKAAATLAKLLEKPWKGFPFEAQTIVM